MYYFCLNPNKTLILASGGKTNWLPVILEENSVILPRFEELYFIEIGKFDSVKYPSSIINRLISLFRLYIS